MIWGLENLNLWQRLNSFAQTFFSEEALVQSVEKIHGIMN